MFSRGSGHEGSGRAWCDPLSERWCAADMCLNDPIACASEPKGRDDCQTLLDFTHPMSRPVRGRTETVREKKRRGCERSVRMSSQTAGPRGVADGSPPNCSIG